MEISLFFGTCCMGIWGRADVDSGVRPAPARYEEASPRFWGITDRGLKPDGSILCSLLFLQQVLFQQPTNERRPLVALS